MRPAQEMVCSDLLRMLIDRASGRSEQTNLCLSIQLLDLAEPLYWSYEAVASHFHVEMVGLCVCSARALMTGQERGGISTGRASSWSRSSDMGTKLVQKSVPTGAGGYI